MSINEAIARIQDIEHNLAADVQDNIEIAAMDAIDIIERRVIHTGKDDSGNSFKDYTDPYKIYKANYGAVNAVRETNRRRKERAATQEAKVDLKSQKKRELPTGPKGHYKGYVDFQLTGDLWKSVGIVIRENAATKSVFSISARDEVNIKKMEGNAKYRVPMLRASANEKQHLRENFKSNMQDRINLRFSA